MEVRPTLRNRKQKKAEVTEGKKQKRAGATPLFRPSAAQKVRGVAPARPPSLRDHICSSRTAAQRTHGRVYSPRKIENNPEVRGPFLFFWAD
jgi:hypothetical protein